MRIITQDLEVEIKNPAIESAILNLLSGRFTKSNLVATHQSVWGVSQRKKIEQPTQNEKVAQRRAFLSRRFNMREWWAKREKQINQKTKKKYAQASWATRKERIKKGLKLLPGPKTKCGPRLLEILQKAGKPLSTVEITRRSGGFDHTTVAARLKKLLSKGLASRADHLKATKWGNKHEYVWSTRGQEMPKTKRSWGKCEPTLLEILQSGPLPTTKIAKKGGFHYTTTINRLKTMEKRGLVNKIDHVKKGTKGKGAKHQFIWSLNK